MNPSRADLRAIERHLHAVMRERAAELIDQHAVALPQLGPPYPSEKAKAWFPIPGMYGGFSYWLEGEGAQLRLVTESWCRVVGGSGQRHVITAHGSELVAEGFV